MNSPILISQDPLSLEDKPFPFLNPLDSLKELLLSHRTKKAQDSMEADTLPKLETMLLTEMLVKGSDEDAHSVLEMLGLWVYNFLASIFIDPRGCEKSIALFLAHNEKEKGAHLFTAAPITLQRHLNHLPMVDADLCLTKQHQTIHDTYDCFNALPTQFVMTVDTSDKEYRGKFHNQFTPFAVEAQSTRPYHAVKESAIYLPQLQLAVDSKIVQISPSQVLIPTLPPWMNQIQEVLTRSEALGELFLLILGDRGYFSTLPHIYSYLGSWLPQLPPIDNPRMVTPTKLQGKKAVKWTYLLDASALVIRQEMMGLNPDYCLLLGDHLKQLPCDPEGKPVVPVVIVAGFDSYRKPEHARTLPWAHEQAVKIEAKITLQATKQASAERAYVRYCCEYLHKTVHPPTYKGRRRVIFENLIEKGFYQACFRVKAREARILKEKMKLCARLFFYTVSVHKGEALNLEDPLLLSIPQQFRERWGTENGFNGLKHRFPVITNNCSPTARHARWTACSMLENSWHYARFYYTFQNTAHPSASTYFQEGTYPEIRKPSKVIFPPELTAQGYLLSNLGLTLNMCLKKSFPTIIKS